MAGAGLAAAAAGLLGVEGGILWIVGGVWTARLAWARRPGIAWAVAILAAGLRWGTLSLADIEAATRASAPSVAAGPIGAAAAMGALLAAALLEEASSGALRSAQPGERLVAAVALLALVPAFVAPGPGEPNLPLSVIWWVAAAAVLVVTTAWLGPRLRSLPGLLAPAVAVAACLGVGLVQIA